MRTQQEQQRAYYFQGDANALGGVLRLPDSLTVGSRASVSLPNVGGFAQTSDENFEVRKIVSYSSAYSRVSGETVRGGESRAILVRSEIRDLNILGVLTAESIVADFSIEVAVATDQLKVSLADSRFVGLRIQNRPLDVRLVGCAGRPGQTWNDFDILGCEQTGNLEARCRKGGRVAWEPTLNRYRWMTPGRATGASLALCSLVDSLVDETGQTDSIGHMFDVPDVGRFFLGELLVTKHSVQLAMVRAELGCNVQGDLMAVRGNGGGQTIPPG
jgi:hypothetical protein